MKTEPLNEITQSSWTLLVGDHWVHPSSGSPSIHWSSYWRSSSWIYWSHSPNVWKMCKLAIYGSTLVWTRSNQCTEGSAWHQAGTPQKQSRFTWLSWGLEQEINIIYSVDFKKISRCYVTANHRALESANWRTRQHRGRDKGPKDSTC